MANANESTVSGRLKAFIDRPPAIVVVERAPWGDGYRPATLMLRVPDREMFARLRQDIRTGERVDTVVGRDSNDRDYPLFVKAYSKSADQASLDPPLATQI